MKTLKTCLVILCLLSFRSVGSPRFIEANFFMKEIPLTRGMVALVDDEDFDRVNKFKWNANKISNTYYACRSVKIPKTRNSVCIYMHRLILGLTVSTQYADHKDHNGLNNQKNNLRICAHHQNLTNLKKRQNTSSKYFGVCFYPNLKQPNKYASYISSKGKRYPLGYYTTEREAALVYNDAAIKLHGEFAKQNNVE